MNHWIHAFLVDDMKIMIDRIQIKFKKLSPDAKLPVQGNPTDAGYDIVATTDGTLADDGRYIEYGTGLAVELPPGYHLKVAPRSSNSKYDLLLCNSEGLIDNAYRGEIKLRFKYVQVSRLLSAERAANLGIMYREGDIITATQCSPEYAKLYKKGDRIAQLKIEKTIYAEFIEADELGDTARGDGGFGSTGR